MYSKIFVDNFDKDNNPIFIISVRSSKKRLRIVTAGKFIIKTEKTVITSVKDEAKNYDSKELYDSIINALDTADWNDIDVNNSCSSFKKLIAAVNYVNSSSCFSIGDVLKQKYNTIF